MTAIIFLIIVGIFLLIAELILPGGVLGLIGVVFLAVAVVLSFKYGLVIGLCVFIGVTVFGLWLLGLWMKHFRKLPVTKSLVMDAEIDNTSDTSELYSLIGKEGVALTTIMPSGHAEVSGKKLDVMTETGTIDKGAYVKVIDIRGPSIFVVEISQNDQRETFGFK